jgi:hypothetical protein
MPCHFPSLPIQRLALVGHVDPNKLPKPLTSLCAICGADETMMIEIDFCYTTRGVLYCGEHYALWERSEGRVEGPVSTQI